MRGNPDWKALLRRSIHTPGDLAKRWPAASGLQVPDAAALRPVTDAYPMRINPYFLDLMSRAGAPVIRQVVPDPAELEDKAGMEDPLGEDAASPVPHLTHRYPDRVLFTVTNVCAVYCRFCTRKRRVGRGPAPKTTDLENGIRYIRNTPAVRDVLISGGDPLMLSDERLEWLVRKIREIRHVRALRIGTRMPCALPSRVTKGLTAVLKKARPVFVHVHFNHPAELTPEALAACRRLADAGAVLGNQTVLLRGVNDDADTLASLFMGLVSAGVRPYYLLQADLTRGTDHFRTRIETGLEIMRRLRGRTSGLALPLFVVDLPGGGGKVPLTPEYAESRGEDAWGFRNYLGSRYTYPQPGP